MANQQEKGGMPGARITEHHKRLEPFVGTFRAEVRIWMGPGEPLVHHGTMRNSWDLNGLALREDYEGDSMPGCDEPFLGRGFWSYNARTGKYEGFWMDSFSSFMQTETGEVDDAGRTWTMFSEMPNPETGEPTPRKTVIKLIDDDHHSMESFFVMPDGTEHKGMEIQYTRA